MNMNNKFSTRHYVVIADLLGQKLETVISGRGWSTDSQSLLLAIVEDFIKEFEADKLGVKMFHDAGYSEDEIFATFDVLMYSYLPFDEIEFPTTYFSNENIFIPPTWVGGLRN